MQFQSETSELFTEYKAATKLDAQHAVGVVQYSHASFSSDDEAYTRYSSLTTVLTTATKAPGGKHAKWGEDCAGM